MTITTHNEYPKRLIEVDLPIARISAHARAEKDSRLGHIPRLHIYPAARPIAACRAVICASLWPDPVDLTAWAERGEEITVGNGSVVIRPRRFLDTARERMTAWANQHLGKVSKESYSRFVAIQNGAKTLADPLDVQRALLDFIADFANWDSSTDKDYLETARALTQAAHEAMGGEPETRPLVVDPFAGGGSIPLEALRVGADAFASDLNPVSVLLNKVVLEYIPKYGLHLADEIRKWGAWVKQEAAKELIDFYPKDPNGATPIAYIWARTIQCEGPGCGAEVPLMRSFWLARKGRSIALQATPDVIKKRLFFTVIENANISDIRGATVARGSVTCPFCGYTTPATSTRAQLKKKRGGSSDARMIVVVADTEGSQGRIFRIATDDDQAAYDRAAHRLAVLRSQWKGSISLVPEEPTPIGGGRGAGRAFMQRNYGMEKWEDIYNRRQLLALTTYATLARDYISRLTDKGFAEACSACLALIIDRLADLNAALCVWQLNTPNTAHVFGRWALQITWDYGEVNPLAGAGGSPESAISRMVSCITDLSSAKMQPGHIERCSADEHPLPDDFAAAFITDPPYYDAVPYSDLLDFFYVWIKRSLGDQFSRFVNSELCPKEEECIVDDIKGKDNAYYEATMQKAMGESRRVLNPNGIGVVVFAHKSTRGWEAQLQAMMNAGLTITASWPIDTEMGSRLRAKGSAALASSVHLVCRPRKNPDGSLQERVGDWRDVLSELPQRIHDWMPRLAEEGVVGADAIFSCLGPALEVFSRYSRVEKASGEVVTLGEYLEHVWAAVSKEALSMIFKDPDTAGLEPDARLTAMWLWTLGASSSASSEDSEEAEDEDTDEESSKAAKVSGFTLEFDAARKIAQGLGVYLEKSPSVVEVKGDKAKLLSVAERVKYLFGKDAETAVTGKTPRKKKEPVQQSLFAELQAAESAAQAEWGEVKGPKPGTTVLDRLHQAMVLFAAGRGEAMKRFIVEEGIGNDARFWKLAQSLTALYPGGSDEKRWVDGVLARKKGLGF